MISKKNGPVNSPRNYYLTQKCFKIVTVSSESFPLSFFILSAVCHVRQITSPTRPMACNEDSTISKFKLESGAIDSYTSKYSWYVLEKKKQVSYLSQLVNAL